MGVRGLPFSTDLQMADFLIQRLFVCHSFLHKHSRPLHVLLVLDSLLRHVYLPVDQVFVQCYLGLEVRPGSSSLASDAVAQVVRPGLDVAELLVLESIDAQLLIRAAHNRHSLLYYLLN